MDKSLTRMFDLIKSSAKDQTENIALILLEPLSIIIKFGLDAWPEDKIDLLKAQIGTMYLQLDLWVESLVEATENKIDDKIVDEMMEALEEKAKELGVELPNWDDD